jgi:hypothetical protein
MNDKNLNESINYLSKKLLKYNKKMSHKGQRGGGNVPDIYERKRNYYMGELALHGVDPTVLMYGGYTPEEIEKIIAKGDNLLSAPATTSAHQTDIVKLMKDKLTEVQTRYDEVVKKLRDKMEWFRGIGDKLGTLVSGLSDRLDENKSTAINPNEISDLADVVLRNVAVVKDDLDRIHTGATLSSAASSSAALPPAVPRSLP